jgi:hypothetical protein
MFGPMPKNYVVVYAKKVHLLRNKIIVFGANNGCAALNIIKVSCI